MLRRYKLLILSLFLTISLQQSGNAQSGISSPYSGFGVGILSNSANSSLSAMGGTAYAISSNRFVNYRNPASYTAFDSLSFIADAAFSLSFNTLSNEEVMQKNNVTRFNYLAIGFPIAKVWRTSLGVLPFSDVGYKIEDNFSKEYTYSYDGTGGLYQFYWGNAFKLAKNLSIGLNASYLWGTIHDTKYAEYEGDYFFNSKIDKSVVSNGLYLSAGLQYFIPLKENHRLGIGVIYENSAYIQVKENLMIGNYTGGHSGALSELDTIISTEGTKGTMKLPQVIGGGLSYSYKDKWLIGADLTWQNWKKFSNMKRSDSLLNNLVFSFGFQYCADQNSAKFLKKLRYRAGFRHATGYMSFQETAIPEYNITLGIGIPLQTFNTNSMINVVLEYGRMGTKAHGLILQDYFRLSFNFILQERWYQRVRLE